MQDTKRNYLVKRLGVTLGWILNYNIAKKCDKILVSGNDNVGKEHRITMCGTDTHIKERRFFFIADIVKIVHLNTYLRDTDGMADEAIRKHHCGTNYPILPPYWDNRKYAIYFTNPSKTYECDDNYRLWQSPVKYIY